MSNTEQYHNTTQISGIELVAEIDNAKKQNDKIMILFKNSPGQEYTPFEVMNIVFKGKTPITSIRRAMSNLTRDFKLLKTDTQRKGMYGKLNYCWKLA